MKITLYNMSSDKRKVGKSKAIVKELNNVTLKENTSIVNPRLLVKSNFDNNLIRANYLYIPSFKKYYFINNIVCGIGGVYELECSVDVLETYKNDIKGLTCLVNRQENKYSPYIPDTELKISTANRDSGIARVLDKYSVGNLGNSFSYVITVNGG